MPNVNNVPNVLNIPNVQNVQNTNTNSPRMARMTVNVPKGLKATVIIVMTLMNAEPVSMIAEPTLPVSILLELILAGAAQDFAAMDTAAAT